MRELHFKDYFWNGELTSTGGYDYIIQHLNDGKRTCKEIEDFMKARASIEEKYAKELLGLSKKVEQQMDALHKQRATQFKKAMESKKTYEQKCRDKEEAEQNMNRNASTSNAKQQEKIFEKQEVERISTLRNMVWTHINQLSQQCVTSDELYEEVRKSLEQCDIQEDIEHFVNLRRTGDKPPAPVLYENFYSSQRVSVAPSFSRTAPPITRRGPLPNPTNTEGDVIYSTVDPGYSAQRF
ncbi:unnamed protein product [Coregonus sp. 'balchen']|nr:unnamed protein product [Coregonus sp. 'balchen']